MTNSTRLICPPWQIKSGHLGCGKLTRRANQQIPVQPLLQKYFSSRLTQITPLIRAVLPHRGALRTSRTRGGMRWTRQRARRTRPAGVRPSRVVLTPRCWRQVLWNFPRGDGVKQAWSPGRARSKLPGRSGVTVVTMLVCFFLSAREAAGASCTRHSLRPLIFRGQEIQAKLARKPRRDRGVVSEFDRHCEEQGDDAIHFHRCSGCGLLRGACHRARIRVTRWLAMTLIQLLAV
jgi:hypothetical protein